MVQETLVARSSASIVRAAPQGALHAYLRQAVRNACATNAARGRQPIRQDIDATVMIDRAPSPLDLAIGDQAAQRYLRALAKLRDDDQQAIVARVELGYSYVRSRRCCTADRRRARMLVTRRWSGWPREMETLPARSCAPVRR